MKTKLGSIEVRIPNADGTGVSERLRVEVPLKWDEELNEWLLTEEAHQIIDDTKSRHMGLISPFDLKEITDSPSPQSTSDRRTAPSR